jgi:RNA polymerase sigma-70 factor (ECF subfamily)
MSAATDELLVYKTIQGNTGAYSLLVERYQHQIYDLAYRMVHHQEDARDISQEIFIKAFRSLDKFRQESKFSTWLYKIATNHCLDFLRKSKREKDHLTPKNLAESDDPVEIPSGSWANPEQQLLQQEKLAMLQKALGELPENYRLPLLMQHYRQLSYQDIAEIMDIPIKTVATRIYRAKNMLKECLAGGDVCELHPDKREAVTIPGRRLPML